MIEAETVTVSPAGGDGKQIMKEQPVATVTESVDQAGTAAEVDMDAPNGETSVQSATDLPEKSQPVPQSSGDQVTEQQPALPPIQLPQTGEEMIEFVSCFCLLRHVIV